MRSVVLCLSAILLFVFSCPVSAQKKKKKEAENDTIQVPFFHGIAVHAELIGLIQTKYSDHGQYEAGVRINLKDRYFPAFELGYGKADETENYVEGSWCKAKAPYFRIGCDFNILKNKHDNYKLFVGIRYAYANFNYDMTVAEVITDDAAASIVDDEDVSDDGEETVTTTTIYKEHNNLKAKYHWLEGIFGVDAKIFGPFHLGWDIRYRRMITKTYDSIGPPWYIPGFGDRKKAGFTATFNLTISI